MNLCKSYALNMSSIMGLLFLAVMGKPMLESSIPLTTGTGGIFGFILVPLSLGMCMITCLLLILEYLAKEFKFNFAYNFPYEKIPLKPVYYMIFYLGLIAIVSPILLSFIIFK